MKKTASVFLLCMMLFLLIAGCADSPKPGGASSPPENSPQETAQADEDPYSELGHFRMSVGHAQAEDNPRHLSLLAFQEEVEEKTNGHVTIDLFANGQLGSEKDMLEQVKAGNIQGFRGGVFDFTPRMLMFTLPFLCNSMEQYDTFIHSDLAYEVYKEEEENTNTVILAVCNSGGFRQFSNNVRPIRHPDDMKGLLMRVNGLNTAAYTFEALGASTVSIPLGETYMSLKTGVCDGQENPYVNIVGQKFMEVQKYFTEVNWQSTPDPFYVNQDWWDTLPAEFQVILKEAAEHAAELNNQLCIENAEQAKQIIIDAGGEIYVPTAEELQAFKDACGPAYQAAIQNGVCTQEEFDTILESVSGT